MSFERSRTEQPVRHIAWSNGIGCPAGIYALEGATHLAADGSPAAHDLEAKGALRIGGIRFDGDPLERAHAGRSYRSLGRDEAVRQLGMAQPPN